MGAKRGRRLGFEAEDRRLLAELLKSPERTKRLMAKIGVEDAGTLHRVARGVIKTTPWRDIFRVEVGHATASPPFSPDEERLLVSYRRAKQTLTPELVARFLAQVEHLSAQIRAVRKQTADASEKLAALLPDP